MFYPNYNIENIGYDNYNDDEMNIVLTNYDENSLYKIEENENIFKRFNILKIRNEIILKNNIINKPLYHIEYIEQLNKFSVQSINQIIELLKIEFNSSCFFNFSYIIFISLFTTSLSYSRRPNTVNNSFRYTIPEMSSSGFLRPLRYSSGIS